MGLIGHGLMGRNHLLRLVGDPEIQVLAVCDVDSLRCYQGREVVEKHYAAQNRAGIYRSCSAYNDYRELLARPDIDAVVIVTPDHWHTLQTIDAVKAGKDVYCEKPISLSVRAGRQLVTAVHHYARVFQTGTQYRSTPVIRQICEFVRRGGLGKVKSVFTPWTTLGGFIGQKRFKPYQQGMDIAHTRNSYVPLEFYLPPEPIPDGLDWDLWLGPAAWHPYNRLYHANPAENVVPWSFCSAFGAAAVTWYHSHAADVIQYALGMEQSGPVEFIHPTSGSYPTLTYRYANGTLVHLVDDWSMVADVYKAIPPSVKLTGNFGGVIVGERGWITSMSKGGPIQAQPAALLDEIQSLTRDVQIGKKYHHANWFECIRTRQKPSCSEELGHRSASLGHLTIIAHKLQRSLKWDPAREIFPGDDQANRLLSRSCRAPWHF